VTTQPTLPEVVIQYIGVVKRSARFCFAAQAQQNLREGEQLRSVQDIVDEAQEGIVEVGRVGPHRANA
jgi:hypothetical protein